MLGWRLSISSKALVPPFLTPMMSNLGNRRSRIAICCDWLLLLLLFSPVLLALAVMWDFDSMAAVPGMEPPLRPLFPAISKYRCECLSLLSIAASLLRSPPPFASCVVGELNWWSRTRQIDMDTSARPVNNLLPRVRRRKPMKKSQSVPPLAFLLFLNDSLLLLLCCLMETAAATWGQENDRYATPK